MVKKATQPKKRNTPDTLPHTGYSRWSQLEAYMPFSRETWRQMVLAGRAPKAHYLTKRCKVWANADVHQWLADPINYRAAA